MSLTTGCPFLKMCDCGEHGWIVTENKPSLPFFSQFTAITHIKLLQAQGELLPEEEKHLREEIKAKLNEKVDYIFEISMILSSLKNVPKNDIERESYYYCPIKEKVV